MERYYQMVDASGEKWAGYTVCHKQGRSVSVFGTIPPAEVESKSYEIFKVLFSLFLYIFIFIFGLVFPFLFSFKPLAWRTLGKPDSQAGNELFADAPDVLRQMGWLTSHMGGDMYSITDDMLTKMALKSTVVSSRKLCGSHTVLLLHTISCRMLMHKLIHC